MTSNATNSPGSLTGAVIVERDLEGENIVLDEQYSPGVSVPDEQHSPDTSTFPHPTHCVSVSSQVCNQLLAGLTFPQPQVEDSVHTAEAPQCPKTTCLYHGPILAFARSNEQLEEEGGMVDRYLIEDPASQYALFVKGDSGQLSTDKGCTCKTIGTELEISDDEEERRHDDENGTQQ